MDTRPSTQVGPRATPLQTQETYSIAVLGTNGDCTIPVDATGLSLNVTVANGSASSFLTVFPSLAPKPQASNLNWVGGQAPVPNAVNAAIGTDGKVAFFNFAGTVDVIVDITGYYVDHNHDDRYALKGLEINFSAPVPAPGPPVVLVEVGTIGGITISVGCAPVGGGSNEIKFAYTSVGVRIVGTRMNDSVAGVASFVLNSSSGGSGFVLLLEPQANLANVNGVLQMADGHVAALSLVFGALNGDCIAQGTVSPA
jgi:hypothetical protein